MFSLVTCLLQQRRTGLCLSDLAMLAALLEDLVPWVEVMIYQDIRHVAVCCRLLRWIWFNGFGFLHAALCGPFDLTFYIFFWSASTSRVFGTRFIVRLCSVSRQPSGPSTCPWWAKSRWSSWGLFWTMSWWATSWRLERLERLEINRLQ